MADHIVMEHVFGYLEWKDRHTASLVSRQWNDILQAPYLSREVNLRILDNYVPGLVFQYLNKYGSHLKILKVKQCGYFLTDSEIALSNFEDSDSESVLFEDSESNSELVKDTQPLIEFFEKLVGTDEVQLTDFVLDFLRYGDPEGDPELIEGICRFLESQKNLKVFKFCSTKNEESRKFLNSALVWGKDTVEVLELDSLSNLEEFVKDLSAILSRFNNLRILKMDYIGTQFLRRISSSGLLSRLELLKICSVISCEDLLHPSCIEDWRYLSNAYRNIKVKYKFNFWNKAQDISELSSDLDFLNVLPVVDLKIVFRNEVYAVYSKFLEFIGEKFKDQIECLSLKGNVDEQKAAEIIELLKKLNALKEIEVESKMHWSLLQFVEKLKKEKHVKVEQTWYELE